MMCVSKTAAGKFIFECTECDHCLPFRSEVGADLYLSIHPSSHHHLVMSGQKVKVDYHVKTV